MYVKNYFSAFVFLLFFILIYLFVPFYYYIQYFISIFLIPFFILIRISVTLSYMHSRIYRPNIYFYELTLDQNVMNSRLCAFSVRYQITFSFNVYKILKLSSKARCGQVIILTNCAYTYEQRGKAISISCLCDIS